MYYFCVCFLSRAALYWLSCGLCVFGLFVLFGVFHCCCSVLLVWVFWWGVCVWFVFLCFPPVCHSVSFSQYFLFGLRACSWVSTSGLKCIPPNLHNSYVHTVLDLHFLFSAPAQFSHVLTSSVYSFQLSVPECYACSCSLLPSCHFFLLI